MGNNNLFIALLTLVLFLSCDQLSKELKPAEISWIKKKGFQNENVEPLRAKGKVPAPEVQLVLNDKKHWLALDVAQPYLILKETRFEIKNFAPTRIVSIVKGNNEMLMEDGTVQNIQVLGSDYDIAHCSLLKQSSEEITSTGLIGRNFYDNKIVTLDFKNGAVAYTEDREIKPLKDSYKISFEMKDSEYVKYPMIYFTGLIDSLNILMTINTTRRFSQISPELAQKITNHQNKKYITVEELQVEKFHIKNIKCRINANLIYSSPRQGDILHFSMGLNILKNYLVTLDLRSSCFFLEKHQKAPNVNNQSSNN